MRKSPKSHIVKAHIRKGRQVRTFTRGKGDLIISATKTKRFMIDQRNLHDVFRQMYPITKDLQPLRAKGVYLEDISSEITEAFGPMNLIDSGKPTSHSNSFHAIETSNDRSVGIYKYNAGWIGSIPTYVVGVKSPQKWEEIKTHLRSKHLIR